MTFQARNHRWTRVTNMRLLEDEPNSRNSTSFYSCKYLEQEPNQRELTESLMLNSFTSSTLISPYPRPERCSLQPNVATTTTESSSPRLPHSQTAPPRCPNSTLDQFPSQPHQARPLKLQNLLSSTPSIFHPSTRQWRKRGVGTPLVHMGVGSGWW